MSKKKRECLVKAEFFIIDFKNVGNVGKLIKIEK